MIFNSNCIRITNLCYHLNLNKEIDLQNLFEDEDFFSEKKYNPQNFSGLRCKYKNVTLLIFRNGKINIVGVKSKEDLQNCLVYLYEHFNHSNVTNYDLVPYNMCTSYKMNRNIDIINIAKKFPLNSSYEPELFAGLIFTNNSVKFTVHRTGVIFATGFKNIDKIISSYSDLFDVIGEDL